MKKLKNKFFKAFPVYLEKSFACHADMAVNKYCVWDDGKPEDCTHASTGTTKEKCLHWRAIEKKVHLYTSDEIWKWIEINVNAGDTK